MQRAAKFLGVTGLLAAGALFALAGVSMIRSLRVFGGYQDSTTWVYVFVGGSELLLAALCTAVAALLLWSRPPRAGWAAVSVVALGASLLPYARVVGPFGWVATGLCLVLAVVAAARYAAHREQQPDARVENHR